MSSGSETTKTEIPQYLQDASKSAISRAGDIANMGYVPYYGPDVAAATGQQIASWRGANQAASAFGMPTAAIDLPKSQTFAGGVEGYSSGRLYDQALRELKSKRPGIYKEYQALTGGGGRQAAQAPAQGGGQSPFGAAADVIAALTGGTIAPNGKPSAYADYMNSITNGR